MTKRRATIRGRGAEILLGEPQPVEVEPLAPGLPLVEEEPPSGDRLPEGEAELDADLEQALEKEALAGVAEELAPEPETPEAEVMPAAAELIDEEPPPPESLETASAPKAPPEPEPAEPPLSVETEDGQPPEPPSEEDLDLDDADLELALEEEALAGAPDGETDEILPPILDEEPPPTPEMEMAFIEEALVAAEPPEPVAEEPVPTLEVTMEEKAHDEEMAMFEPPPSEVSDVVEGVLPPKKEGLLVDLGEEPTKSYDIQERDDMPLPIELPDRELSDEEKEQVLAWLAGGRLAELSKEIDEAYHDVRRKVGDSESIATECYNKLLKARDIVSRRDLAKIAQAEYNIELVQARLKRAADSATAAKKNQWPILAWGLFWCAVFLAVQIMLTQRWFQDLLTPSGQETTLVDMEIFLAAMIWGGIGGVVAVLYSLFKHVGRRDFDPNYNISYVGKPFLGLILGATVYMIFNLVIRTLGILPAGLEAEQQVAAPTVAPGVIYLVAWASGFKENRIFDLVDRVMKRIFSGGDDEEQASPSEPAEPGT